MIFWIDGHNLIGALPDIDLADPDDEARLLARLQTFVWRGGHRLLVFFDQGEGGQPPLDRGPDLEVRFAPHGLTADDLILAALEGVSRGTLQSIMLVTSDRALQTAARAAGVRVQTARSFARQLQTLEAEGDRPAAEESPSLSPDESDELLRQFEARRRERARAAADARARRKRRGRGKQPGKPGRK